MEQPINLAQVTRKLVREGVQFLEDRQADGRPFLLFVSWLHVHTALATAPRFRGQSPLGPYGEVVTSPLSELVLYLIVYARSSAKVTSRQTRLQTTNKGPHPLSVTIGRQTDTDVTIGLRVVSDRNLTRAILIRQKTLSDGGVRVCLLP